MRKTTRESMAKILCEKTNNFSKIKILNRIDLAEVEHAARRQ